MLGTLSKGRHLLFWIAGGAAVGSFGLWAGIRLHHAPHAAPRPDVPRLVYTPKGYGGFAPAPAPVKAAARREAEPDPVQPVRDAYNAGRFQDVEREAGRVVAGARGSRSVARRRQGAEARSLLAYAAARRHDLKLARTRFAAAQTEAAKLPDRGKTEAQMGQNLPTLEEDAAYQHAVCTAALGDKAGAEAEYLAFMRAFPESPLVQGAVKRIAMLHGGDIPPAAEAAWRRAEATALARQQARDREQSLCGPECLAELLRRRGGMADIHALANEMHTSDRGTTLAALADAAKAHGCRAEGVALTQKGLSAQKLPVLALVTPGHYVLVDAVTLQAVTIWNPDAHGIGRGDAQILPLSQWRRQWHGIALTLAPAANINPAVQTAKR